MLYIVIFILLGLLFYQWINYRRTREEDDYQQISATEEFKKTVALGIYQRFCKEDEEKQYSSMFLKNDPLDFEHFVASALKHKYGYDVFVTKPSGDYGVDVEHGTGDAKVLGQAKCYRENVGYEPIAILHSNMVKQNASRGYVVTTSGFTKQAIRYAEDLDIDLISGTELVDYWISSSNHIIKVIDHQQAFKQTTTDTMSV